VPQYTGKEAPLVLPTDTIAVWVAQFEPDEFGIEYQTESGISGGTAVGTRVEAAYLAALINSTIRARRGTEDVSWLK
jgi:hypothetical protein